MRSLALLNRYYAYVRRRRRRMPPNTTNPPPTSSIESGAGAELNELADCRPDCLLVSAVAPEGCALAFIMPMTDNNIKKSRQRPSVRMLAPSDATEWAQEEVFASSYMGAAIRCSRNKLG